MFTPEEIERMSPAIREELQELLVTRHKARRKTHVPERRASRATPIELGLTPPRGNGWPRVWNVHDPDQAYLREVRKGAKVATQG